MTFRVSVPAATATLILIPGAMLAWDLFLRPQPPSLSSGSSPAMERHRPATPSPPYRIVTQAQRDNLAFRPKHPHQDIQHTFSNNPSRSTAPPVSANTWQRDSSQPPAGRSLHHSGSSVSSPAGPPAATIPSGLIATDPAGSGNQFTAHGQLVEVTASETSPAGPVLHIQLKDTAAASPSSPSQGNRVAFTLEEELFRAKWGWEAFDRVQRAAFQEASLAR